jgi:glycerate kinase
MLSLSPHLRVVVAPCSFKGTLSARAAARAIAKGLAAHGVVDVDECPLPDGGEGTLSVLVPALARRTAGARGAEARRGLIRQLTDGFGAEGADRRRDHGLAWAVVGDTAYVESAAYVGLTPDNDWRRSSAPLGRAVRRACAKDGVVRVVVALGGTGVVDGGAGYAGALGDVDVDRGVVVDGLVDVWAPLLGATGARQYYAQKGVPADAFDDVDAALAARLGAVKDVAGAGAAGGLGGALVVRGGALASGADAVIDAVGLVDRVASADVVVAGEGAVDAQTLQGKSLARVRALARAHNKPFVVVCGRCDLAGAAAADLADHVVVVGAAGLVGGGAAVAAAVARWR